jgi:ATP-binding cassette, subfamily B, bacterial
VRAAGEDHRRLQGELHSHLHQSISGMPVVQAFGQEDRVAEKFDALAEASVAAEQRKTVATNINKLASGGVTALGHGIVLFFGARLVLTGGMSVGELLVFVSYLKRLQGSLAQLAAIYPALQGLRPQVQRVMEVLEPETDVPEGPLLIGRVRGHVRYEDVTFGYATDRPVLQNISFDAEPGETVALVGATGAGKTTIANLLMRFYDPQGGRVLVDDLDVRMLRLEGLRQQIAYVPQEAYLFQASIADNIGLGDPQADRHAIVAAARLANADEFIERLPDGFDTVVGGRGSTLSGGQRQRIAIARAILKDAPVLILDEPTSALDANTEALVMSGLERLMEGRTTLVVAHRLSTIRRADRIVVLDEGRVVESGSHAELLERGGFYARLHALQFGHDDLEVISDRTLAAAGGHRG